jgi:protein phosphatase
MRATVQHIELPAHRRAFAVSDVHGNLDLFRGLLDKIRFSRDDILILLGDLVEKGPHSIETLHYIMDLCKTHTVYVLRGNCDQLLLGDTPNEWLFRFRTHWGGHMLVNEFAQRLNCPLRTPDDVGALRERVRREFPQETAFLTGLPVILESDHYIFVHGGVPGEDSLRRPEGLEDWACMKNDDFLSQGHVFREHWCVVGHWPTTLYRRDYPCADPLVSPSQQIVSIDGGCVIKRDGQLNALHLPPVPSADRFTWTSYDALPTGVAQDAQAPSPSSVYIRYGDNALKILERGEEFSTCLHLSTGQTVDILTRDLWETGEGVFCEDSTDYLLPVQPGDLLSVIQSTSRGWLVKKDGITGWYRGALTWGDTPCGKP